MVVFILFFKKYFKKKNLYTFLDVLIFQFKISIFFSVVQVLLSLQSFPPKKKNRKKKEKAKKKSYAMKHLLAFLFLSSVIQFHWHIVICNVPQIDLYTFTAKRVECFELACILQGLRTLQRDLQSTEVSQKQGVLRDTPKIGFVSPSFRIYNDVT